MELDKVLEKIKKLQTLAQSSNINEALNATNLANQLIDKYRITESQLNFNSEIIKDTEAVYSSGRKTMWKNNLLQILANHYGCDVINHKGYRDNSYFLYGRKSDIQFCRSMFDFVMNRISYLSSKECKGEGHIVANSYCLGAVKGFSETLKSSREEAFKDNTSTDIVLINNRSKEARDFANTLCKIKNVKEKSASKIDYDSYNSGIKDGRNIKTNILDKQ